MWRFAVKENSILKLGIVEIYVMWSVALSHIRFFFFIPRLLISLYSSHKNNHSALTIVFNEQTNDYWFNTPTSMRLSNPWDQYTNVKKNSLSSFWTILKVYLSDCDKNCLTYLALCQSVTYLLFAEFVAASKARLMFPK